MSNQPAPAVALNYPLAWQRRYFEQGYHHIDPVVIHTPAIARPFQWSDLPKRFTLTQRQTLLFNEAREAGLRSGVSVPLHGPWGRVAVVSYAADHERCDAGARLGQLNALAAQFHVALSQFGQTPDAIIELSQRERDCLAWTAQGKSSWDIGMILNISENTVNFHIKNVMRKLDTTSRTVAVIKAIRLGLIEIANLG
jgi:DNA-binding CsgD family transcriptional regulator